MTPERNLLILHTPMLQDVSDWKIVKRKIGERAPDIEVRIGDNLVADEALSRWQASRPSVVFSPYRIRNYVPEGGKVYAGRGMSKLDEVERLRRGLLPVPPTVALRPNLWLPVDEWGEYVVVKPSRGALGRAIRLVRTVDLARRWPELSDMGQEMLVQRFVEHVDPEGRPTTHRVLVMFGTPLYALVSHWKESRPPLEVLAASSARVVASNGPDNREREVLFDDMVIGLAGRAAAVFPELPVLAVDVLRETGTGKLHVLEVNPSGASWHLSSNTGRQRYHRASREALYRQFDALERVAELLVERTRAEAM